VKLNPSTAHIQRGLPVMALVAALIRLRWRRERQMKLWEKR
jgi:hypothetical protein